MLNQPPATRTNNRTQAGRMNELILWWWFIRGCWSQCSVECGAEGSSRSCYNAIQTQCSENNFKMNFYSPNKIKLCCG